MARYIQLGLKAIGYSGITGWDPDDPATLHVLVDNDEWLYNETTQTLTLPFVWGKDSPFTITIQER